MPTALAQYHKLRLEMEHNRDDWPSILTNQHETPPLSGSDALAVGLGNLVMSDCSVAFLNFHAISPIGVEAGWSAIYVVRLGACWLSGEGIDGAVQLQTGDLVLLPQGKQHSLRQSNSSLPVDGRHVPGANPSLDGTRTHLRQQSTAETQVLTCRFRNHVGQISALLTALPSIVHIPGTEGHPPSAFAPIVSLIEGEIANLQPGRSHVVGHLIQLLFMQAIRFLLSGERPIAVACQTAIRDPVIGTSLGLINARLGTAWTLASLAEAVGVSRSTFAARFVEKVGMTPLHYLWRRRMERAITMLCENDLGIKEIASRIGYKSESAFSTAFKRWAGTLSLLGSLTNAMSTVSPGSIAMISLRQMLLDKSTAKGS
ncbi:MAG: ykgD [Planctomycetaceae bacterium]|nr:ykgD [Planctomycetaceae bacterium]